MQKHVVKYDNYMNSLSLGALKSSELDTLMAICSKMKERGTSTVEFDFAEIREIAELTSCDSRERFASAVSSLSRKLVSIYGHIETDDEDTFFTLFNRLSARKKTGVLEVSVNPEYAFVLNDLTSNFTSFELQEFVRLKSKYSKNLYRLLKQFDNTNSGWRRFEATDLRDKLGCPQSYQNKRFVAEILTPCIEELKPIFHELTLEIDRARRQGAPITGYEFRWRPCVNDELPGQVSFDSHESFDAIASDMRRVRYTDEEGKTQYRMRPSGRKNEKIHNYDERSYSAQDYAEMLAIASWESTDGKDTQTDS